MDKSYYQKQADRLGWGPKTARLNPERVKLLDKYVLGDRVLDIGCGSGIYVDYLVKKGKEATGVDFVPDFIKQAKKKYQGKFKIGDSCNLPFKNKSFETVIMIDVLEHLVDEEKALKEAIRVARKRLMIILPRKVDRMLEKHGLVFRHYADPSHLRYYDEKSLRKLANKLKIKKLRIIKIRPIFVKSLFLHQFKGSLFLKRVISKIVFTILKPVQFHIDIALIGDMS